MQIRLDQANSNQISVKEIRYNFEGTIKLVKSTFQFNFPKRLSIKYVCSQGGRRFVRCRHFADKGVFRCGSPHFLVQKASDFSKFTVCPHGQGERELSQCGHFSVMERLIFCDFVRMSFMDGP